MFTSYTDDKLCMNCHRKYNGREKFCPTFFSTSLTALSVQLTSKVITVLMKCISNSNFRNIYK